MLSSYQLYAKYSPNYIDDDIEYLDDLLEEHRAIYEAFRNKDPDAGERAMADHMDRSMARHKQ
jgi:DNA-binding FadR family transcriptional regulator